MPLRLFAVLLHSMKAIFAYILLSLFLLSANAQDDRTKRTPIISSIENIDEEEGIDESELRHGMVPVTSFVGELPAMKDSLHLPTLDYSGRMPMPLSWRYRYLGGFGLWDLHEGLNVNLGLSAFTSFGDYKFSGWTQNIAALYAAPITDKLSFAIGGYFNNMNTNIGNIRDAGFTALLNYRFNEHWEAYVFAQKSIVSNIGNFANCGPWGPYGMYGPMGMYGMGMYGPMGCDRIGAGVRYNFNPSTSIQIQFEYDHMPNSFHNNVSEHWEMPTPKD